MNKYILNINDVKGVCDCGCIIPNNYNFVYKENQVLNYLEILNTYNKKYWCCDGCINNYYKDGKDKSWIDK